MVVPYPQGISKSFRSICKKYGIQVYFMGGKAIKNLLVSPKDKDNIKKKSDVIYWFRTFEGRYKEHLKAPSPIHEHQNSTGHITSVEILKYGKSSKGGPYTSE